MLHRLPRNLCSLPSSEHILSVSTMARRGRPRTQAPRVLPSRLDDMSPEPDKSDGELSLDSQQESSGDSSSSRSDSSDVSGSEYEVEAHDQSGSDEDDSDEDASRAQTGPDGDLSDGDDSVLGHPVGFDPTEQLDDKAAVDLRFQAQSDLNEVEQCIQQHMDSVAAAPGDDDFIDLDELHNGALHPASHYREGIALTKEDGYRRKVYAPGTEKLIVHAETHWRRQGRRSPRDREPFRLLD